MKLASEMIQGRHISSREDETERALCISTLLPNRGGEKGQTGRRWKMRGRVVLCLPGFNF